MHYKLLDFPSSPSYCQAQVSFMSFPTCFFFIYLFFFNSKGYIQSDAMVVFKLVSWSKQAANSMSILLLSYLKIGQFSSLKPPLNDVQTDLSPSSSSSFAFQVCSEVQNKSLILWANGNIENSRSLYVGNLRQGRSCVQYIVFSRALKSIHFPIALRLLPVSV